MFEKAKRRPRRHSLDFIQKHRRRSKMVEYETESTCSSSASTLLITPLPLLESEKNESSSTTTTSSPHPMSLDPVVSVFYAKVFLVKVQATQQDYQRRTASLNASIRQQVTIAKGRYTLNGNTTGACLAMKKAQTMQRERNVYLQALERLGHAVVELQVALHMAVTSDARVQIGRHGQVLVEVDQLLVQAKKQPSAGMGRQQLLRLLQELL